MDSMLVWQNGLPYSSLYDDIYFSRESGIAETRHVFLENNHLTERWRHLKAGSCFVIAETGFGSGLNFLCAWQLWQQLAPASARLHFISTEMHPLASDDLRRALDLWPELAEFSTPLLAQYGAMAPGWHRLTFAQGRVVLTLLVGDARDALPRLDACVDAWFLDGFAPSKNPQMWAAGIFQTMAQLSATNATFSTFTSAGKVRRGLEDAGFKVEKAPGYGNKREILRGVIQQGRPCPIALAGSVVVIGGGLAGCASAYALAQRGYQVTLVERQPTVAAEASGNHQGVLYARLMPKASALSELTLSGYQHALRLLHQLLPQGEDTWQQCGLLQLAFDAREAARLQGIFDLGLPSALLRQVSQAEASALAGIDLAFGGLMFPGGAWVFPRALCQALLQHPAIRLCTGNEAMTLVQADACWEVHDTSGMIASSVHVVVACANQSQRFSQTAYLPLRSIRGQVTHLPMTESSQALQKVICTEGYVVPARHGIHTTGATYGNLEQTLELRSADHQENLDMLSRLSPDLYQALNVDALQIEHLHGRAACRCNVVDYLPVVGAVSPAAPNLYVNTGHGSRGLITTMLAGEALAALISKEPHPLPVELMQAMSPSRFVS